MNLANRGWGAYQFTYMGRPDGYYQIKYMSQCLEVSGASMENHAPVALSACNGADNQGFAIVPANKSLRPGTHIRAKHSGLYLSTGKFDALVQADEPALIVR